MISEGQFDEASVRRIIRSVLWTEMDPRNLIRWPRFQTRRGRFQPNSSVTGVQYAVVTVEAPPCNYTRGEKYFKLEADSEASNGGRGKAILLEQLKEGDELQPEWESMSDPDGTGTDFDIEDVELWVVSAYDNVPLEVGKLIRVGHVPPPQDSTQAATNYTGGFGGRVKPGTLVGSSEGTSEGTEGTGGSSVDASPVIGEYVSPDDYHRAKTTYNETVNQILHHLAKVGTGEEEQEIIWGGGECAEGTGT